MLFRDSVRGYLPHFLLPASFCIDASQSEIYTAWLRWGFLLRHIAGIDCNLDKTAGNNDQNTCSIGKSARLYTVLVTLYKEAEVVSDLLAVLERLVWPRSRLEIRLILEEHDTETLAAIQEYDFRPNIEVLTVPDLGSITKRKLCHMQCRLFLENLSQSSMPSISPTRRS